LGILIVDVLKDLAFTINILIYNIKFPIKYMRSLNFSSGSKSF